MNTPQPKDWPRAPLHRLSASGIYIVTAGTYQKAHLFHDTSRLQALHDGLLGYAKRYGWQLEAWAVFPNHYHFVGRSPEGSDEAESLARFIKHFHGRASAWLNKLDNTPGRRVWHNYWETRLTYERSYFARLNYVHQNPVKHGLVHVANRYRWCSAAWLEQTASSATVRTIYGYEIDQVKVVDDY